MFNKCHVAQIPSLIAHIEHYVIIIPSVMTMALFQNYHSTNVISAHWFAIEENHLVLRHLGNPAQD